LLDPCSSGRWFTGWSHSVGQPPPPSTLDPPHASHESAVESARTWVLRTGWMTRGGGPIHLGEVPRVER
jgi:hypothetical protein